MSARAAFAGRGRGCSGLRSLPQRLVGCKTSGVNSGNGHCRECRPCVAQLTSPVDRLVALQSALVSEPEPLTTLTHLLHLCRDEHRALWEHVRDPASTAQVIRMLAILSPSLPAAGRESLIDEGVRSRLATAFDSTGEVHPVVIAHALAQLLDDRYGHSFTESFQRRSPYQPSVGDPIPLDSLDLRTVVDMRFTSPPWRLANRLDETRRIRLAGEWAVQFRIVFDFSVTTSLTDLITADTVIATCHPNDHLHELDLSRVAGGRTFPIGPVDPVHQRVQIYRLIGMAVAAGATIVLLPELCVTERLARDLEYWVRRAGGPRLLVAGSFHHEDEHGLDQPVSRRRNTAMTWLRGHDGPLLHDKHSPADRPVVEDIQPQGWPELRVFVSADGCHLVTAICRDLLNPQAVHALAEVGANLVLVPAMSETLMAFGGPVAQLVGSSQALVAVANNPGDWSGEDRNAGANPARALFGHPGLRQQTRFVTPVDSAPGVALLHVSSGEIQWLPSTDPAARLPPQQAAGPVGPTSPSRWRHELAQTLPDRQVTYTQLQAVPLRQAAVLVLLTEGAKGIEVLLTERAADLQDYPGELVFPGGAAEPGDTGPVITALREAREEVGLEGTSIEVLGVMSATALSDSGFLVYPVLAWSAQPRFAGSPNIAEVNSLVQLPLCWLANRGQAVRPWASGVAEMPRLGNFTSDVLDLLLARLARVAAPADEPVRSAL
jgi:8-oxo-dGTP pyrophosphatase MutT (NUDIX family)